MANTNLHRIDAIFIFMKNWKYSAVFKLETVVPNGGQRVVTFTPLRLKRSTSWMKFCLTSYTPHCFEHKTFPVPACIRLVPVTIHFNVKIAPNDDCRAAKQILIKCYD